MTDLIMIPFAGSVPSNGPGGANAHNLPNGGFAFNLGSGGGFNPASGYGASNSGTNNGLTQYFGYFQLVAYKKKKIVPVLLPGGGMSNTTIYEGQKMSGWRKYIVTCEPQQNTGIPQGPTGIFNPVQNDAQTPDAPGGLVSTHPNTNPRTPFAPGALTTGQIDKRAADIARKRKVEARRKAAKAAIAAKRKAATAVLAKRRAVAAALVRYRAATAVLAKRRAVAAALVRHRAAAAALAKRRAVAAALVRRKAVAAALTRNRVSAATRRRVAPKRRTIAPVRVMRLRAR